jgi:hypothetical protein
MAAVTESRRTIMKIKKTNKPRIRDLRDEMPVGIEVGNVSGEFAGLTPAPALDQPRIVSPDIGVQTPGQTTHE